MVLDPDDMQAGLGLLEDAQAHARAGRLAEAAKGYLAAGTWFLQGDNVFAAGAVLEEGLHALATSTALHEEKTELSELSGEALRRRADAGDRPRAEIVARVFEQASRFWGKSERPFSGQRGLCFRCGAWKPLAWMRCVACSTSPELFDVTLSLLLSERVCSVDRLAPLAGGVASTPHRLLAKNAAKYLADALMPERVTRLPDLERLIPGVLHSAVDRERRVAVLLELTVGSEVIPEKPAFKEFVQALSARLMDGGERSDLERTRKELERRFGAGIEVCRTERLSAEHGAVAISALDSAHRRSELGIARRTEASTLVVSAVAIEAEHSITEQGPIHDFAGTLARQLLAMSGHFSPSIPRAQTALLEQNFEDDPSLSVEQAMRALSDVLGVNLTVASAARFVRQEYRDDDPDQFPGAQAMRA
jgi:hypothetical protein